MLSISKKNVNPKNLHKTKNDEKVFNWQNWINWAKSNIRKNNKNNR